MGDPLKSTSRPALDPGNLIHRIEIRQKILDPYGNVARVDTILRTRANISTIKLTETTKTLVSEVTHVVSMRFPRKAGISPGMWVGYRLHEYRIQAIENVEERDLILKLHCLALNDAANPDLVPNPIDP